MRNESKEYLRLVAITALATFLSIGHLAMAEDGPISESGRDRTQYGPVSDPYANAYEAAAVAGVTHFRDGSSVTIEVQNVGGRDLLASGIYRWDGKEDLGIYTVREGGTLTGYNYSIGNHYTYGVGSTNGGRSFDVLYAYDAQSGGMISQGGCDLASLRAWHDRAYRNVQANPNSSWYLALYTQADKILQACKSTLLRNANR